MNRYTPIIGLEVHVELKTKSKMFCECSADYFGQKPNTHTCPVCLGLPGALPVPNKVAIEWCMRIATALNCKIAEYSKFDRKNYFYPDLSKGYQISQYDMPFGEKGYITLSSGTKIGITRVHMEEDTGKLAHNGDKSLIDFNRSGVPLVEIVTEPDFHSSSDVKEYLQKLQQIVRYLDVSNADMEKGDMRLEPNISLCEISNFQFLPILSGSRLETTSGAISKDKLPKYKVEVKNINSFRFVEKAIEYEIVRQTEILEKGETPIQETRGWNEVKNKTISQRVKEEANDYRYFPEPDIAPFRFTEEYISTLQSRVPELPEEKKIRFETEFSLTSYDAEILTREIALADYFEKAVDEAKTKDVSPKQIANYIINKKPDITAISPLSLISLISKGTQTVLPGNLDEVISKVLTDNEKAVTDYKSGKETVIMYLVGMVMRNFKEKIDAQMVKEKLIIQLNK